MRQKLPALAALLIASSLLIIQWTGEQWAAPAAVAYSVYLLALGGVAIGALRGRLTGAAVLVLWAVAGPMLIVAAYAGPAGWTLWARTLMLFAVALLTFYAPLHVRRSNALIASVALSLSIFGTYALDRAIVLVDGERRPGGLVFPRNSVVRYETPEFAHSVFINTYGFRGSSADLGADASCRVMLLGDSFTYGWGVDYEQTWGALLEDALNIAGVDAVVYNLGVPGTGTADYAVIAERSMPPVQPDVVLVGVLQGDDLRQVTREPGVFPRSLTFGERTQPSVAAVYLTFHYPFLAERTLLRRVSAGRIRAAWAGTAAGFLESWSAIETGRYQQIPAEIQSDFEAGRINPHFVTLAVTAPDYWDAALNSPEELAPFVTMMVGHLRTVAVAADGAEVLVLSMPHGAYTQPDAWNVLRSLGFTVPEAALTSDMPDVFLRQAAGEAGLVFVTATEAFRQNAVAAFYPVDGHLNVAGNVLFAEAILPDVLAACQRAS